MLWRLISVLSFTAVALPLLKPRRYVAFNPSDPMPPNPEQTASWLSLLLFGFLDATIWKAYRAPHLPLSDLPPLADSDHSKNLVRAAFPHLDPHSEESKNTSKAHRRPRRHIFLAVATVFKREIIVVTLLLLLNNAATLLSPYGLKQLLEYLGNRNSATVKPWVWIASLFFAPLSSTLIMQQYQALLARATVQLEAILTQLMLQHALRIRVVADTGSSTDTANVTAAPSAAPSVGSGSGSSTSSTESEETVTLEADPKLQSDSVDAKAGKSLVGRMNNLISSDLQTITKAAEFMQVFVSGPVLIVFTIGFLYTILGWSALVGFVVLLGLMPFPVLLSGLLQGAAKEMSKKSDDRVETD
ncbi:hypothetical protein DXG03_007918 [Asterophora parasitica]|uniref:ABC transmembrane type-1 domain-containing protein n=1 Tax=Asterophora parasitica TaxID=117018 RepID=A0A9P7GCD0_9AGAR|nr:hypothetical protein DXG03_007918 [Asterophora parasitica]